MCIVQCIYSSQIVQDIIEQNNMNQESIPSQRSLRSKPPIGSRASPQQMLTLPSSERKNCGSGRKPSFVGHMRVNSDHTEIKAHFVRSPSQKSNRSRGMVQPQIKKPLEDAEHEEAYAESENMSFIQGDDDTIWTDRKEVECRPTLPFPIESNDPHFLNKQLKVPSDLQTNPLSQSMNPLSQSMNIAASGENSGTKSMIISPEQLIHVLTDSMQQSVDGELKINGRSFKVMVDHQGPLQETQSRLTISSYAPDQPMFQSMATSPKNFNMTIQPREQQHSNMLYQPAQQLDQPPMNEQRSTDEPIVRNVQRHAYGNSLQQNRQHCSQILPEQPNIDLDSDIQNNLRLPRQSQHQSNNFYSSFGAVQNPTGVILPKINQSISGGSLSPEDSASVESIPLRSRSILQSSLERNALSAGLKTVLNNYEPPKINNFIDIEENDDNSSSNCSNIDRPASACKDQQPFKPAILEKDDANDAIVLCDLEQPSLGVSKSGSKGSDVRRSAISFELMSSFKLKDGILNSAKEEQRPLTAVTEFVKLGEPQKVLPDATPNFSSKKKKKKGKSLKIQIAAPNKVASEQTRPGTYNPSIDLMKKLSLGFTELQPGTPKMGQQKSVYDDFLRQLEEEVGSSKRRKSSKRKNSGLAADNGNLLPRDPRHKPINLDELEKETIKAQMRRNNSDSIRSKDELKPKRMILRELQDLKDSLIYQQDIDKSEIDIGFLHASPIFIEGLDYRKMSLVPLKFQEEKKAIVEAIKQSDQQVRFKQSVATKDKFIEMIRKRPRCLHISCHGFDQEGSSMKLMREDDARNLLFESENGDGKLISQRELSKILKQATTKIKVVFVAACMSQFVGEIFRQCDVPHVICSQQGKTILDQAAISFSHYFYTKLLSGEVICKAFQQAKDDVSFNFGEEEANRFQLMISTGQHKHKPKNCTTRWPLKRGDLDCRSDHIKFKHIRAKITNFIPREIEFFQLVKHIQDEHKLVHFRGLPGIGKTYLIRNVLHFLSERKYFSAGILYFPLNEIKSASQFLIMLRNRAIQFYNLTAAERFELRRELCSETQITDFMINIFDDKALPESSLIKSKHFTKTKNRRFLLALDNCETLIEKEGKEFRQLLSYFCDQCKLLKIIVISRNQLGSSMEGEQIQPLILPQLGSKQAVQFFLDVIGDEKSRSINTEEISELILGSPYYPVCKGIPNQKIMQIPPKVTETFRAEIRKLIESQLQTCSDNSKLVDILSYHELFRLLQGNPTSLSRAANIYVNPFNQVWTLLDLYIQVKLNNISEEGQDSEQQHKADDNRPKPRLNNESLQTTTKLAIEMLPTMDARNLLYFIGCMPSGATLKQLNSMWGDQKVSQDLPILLSMNLLEYNDHKKNQLEYNDYKNQLDTRYELSPVLCQFIEQDISRETHEKNMKEIIEHYAVVMKEVYRQVAFLPEEISEEGASPTEIYTSPRKLMTMRSAFSFNDSQDSFTLDQLSELKGGLQKNSMKVSSRQGQNSMKTSGMWSKQPTIDISLPSKAQVTLKDWPNLEACMQFLVNMNSSHGSENSYMRHNTDSPGQEVMSKLNESGRNIFSQTFCNVKTNVSGSEVLSNIQQNNINRLSSRNLKQIVSDMKLGQQTVFESASSISSSPEKSKKGVPISVGQVSSEDSLTMQRQSSSQNKNLKVVNRKSIVASQNANSHLAVIEETHEHRSKDSQQSQHSEEELQVSPSQSPSQQSASKRNNDSLEFSRKNSSPFIISTNQLDPSRTSSIHSMQSRTTNNNRIGGRIEPQMVREKSLALNLTDTITKCDKVMSSLKERDSIVRIHSSNLGQIANNRPIIENLNEETENISSSDEERQPQDQEETKDNPYQLNGRMNSKQVLIDGGRSRINSIKVTHMNLESDRTDKDRPDPLASIRSGDDLEDSSKVSDFQYMAARDDFAQEMISINNSGGFQKPLSARQNSAAPKIVDSNGRQFEEENDHFNSAFLDRNILHTPSDVGRRNTVNQQLERKVSLFDHESINVNNQNSTMKLQPKLSIFEKKRNKQMKALDQSARFTLRKSIYKVNSPKNVSLAQVPRKINQSIPTPSPISLKVDNSPESAKNDKMTLFGQFVIYTAAITYLVDDFTFAYYISSTYFEGIQNQILFRGNILRLKALSAEQIFIQYYDPKQPENSFPLVAYLIEAITSAQEALEQYQGEQQTNEYGIALQRFHLGYLYEGYASHLCTPMAQQTYEAVCSNMTEALFREKARGLFKLAYQSFEVKEHLKGMYLAKKHEANLFEEVTEATSPQDRDDLAFRRQSAIDATILLQRNYFAYVQRFGYEKCSYIPRHHGEEISLLTEIVEENQSKSLFHAKRETSSYENQGPENRRMPQISLSTIKCDL